MKKTILALAMLLIGVLSASAKTEKRPTYLYGFATNSFAEETLTRISCATICGLPAATLRPA